MPSGRSKTVNAAHQHHWIDNGTFEQKCISQYFGGSCIAILVSEEEWRRRDGEYQSYLDLLKTTEAYQDFIDMRSAFFNKDSKIVKELLKRASERLEKNEYLPKPSFPDPQTFPYVIDSLKGLE